MGTPISDVLDMALTVIQDYKIDKLYASEQGHTQWLNYLMGFLKRAVPLFTNCKQSLVYDITSNPPAFNSTLTYLEQYILAQLTVVQWLDREINNINQMNWQLNDNDFKHYSEAENLKQKTEHRDRLREQVNQSMVDYGILNIDWEKLKNGNWNS